MTTFAELYTATVDQTKRPELQAITEAAIRTAVLRAHHVDFFSRDLSTAQLTYTVVANAQFYEFQNISGQLPRLRQFKLLHGLSETLSPVEKFGFREIDDLIGEDGCLKLSSYTRIGDTLRIYPSLPTGILEAFYYANPIVSNNATFSSWIADENLDNVARWAAAIVFTRSGFTEMAQRYQEEYVRPFKDELIQNYLVDEVN